MNPIDQAILITGGGSGLGAASARRLAAAGAKIIVADLNATAAEAIAKEIGPSAKSIAADVTDPAAICQAIELARANFGPLRGVVHCAGILGAGRIVGKQGPHDLALFERILRVNLTGTFNVIRLAAAAMTDNAPLADGERGVIIATASVAAFEGQIGQAAYSAAKGGVASMTLPIARELARFGVRMVSIAPGAFETPMLAGLTPEASQALSGPFPNRLGRPDEFAQLAQQIIENPMLNGVTLRLDGALRMPPK